MFCFVLMRVCEKISFIFYVPSISFFFPSQGFYGMSFSVDSLLGDETRDKIRQRKNKKKNHQA